MNAIDKDGSTALLRASLMPRAIQDVIQYLVMTGADCHSTNLLIDYFDTTTYFV